MADTKISDLTAASTLTGTEKIPLSDGTTTTKAATAQQIKDLVENAPIFAAGSATAGSWPVFSHSSSLLTTPEHGAMEHGNFGLYFTPEPGNRGIIGCNHLTYQNAARTLNNVGTEQQLFNQSTNGRLNLAVGTYRFHCMFILTSMSATSGNLGFDLLGTGTAAFGTVMYHVIGADSTTLTSTGTRSGIFATAAQATAPIVAGATGTSVGVQITGVFEISTAGTIQPSVTLSTAAAAVLAAGSHFECWSIGDTSVGTVGDWS